MNIPASSHSYFLAGTMQGSRTSSDKMDQDYRQKLRAIIERNDPMARIYCPEELMAQRLGPYADAIRQSHASLADLSVVKSRHYDSPLRRLTGVFNDLSGLAGQVDVVVAYLPDHEASMGTAVEMWNGRTGGAQVITISAMKQNLAVLATSDVIVPDFESFDMLLADRWVHEQTPEPRALSF